MAGMPPVLGVTTVTTVTAVTTMATTMVRGMAGTAVATLAVAPTAFGMRPRLDVFGSGWRIAGQRRVGAGRRCGHGGGTIHIGCRHGQGEGQQGGSEAHCRR